MTELWKWRQVYVMLSSVLSFWFIPKEKNAISSQYQKKKFCFDELEKPKKGEGCDTDERDEDAQTSTLGDANMIITIIIIKYLIVSCTSSSDCWCVVFSVYTVLYWPFMPASWYCTVSGKQLFASI
jgi:hypothetical protein